MSRLGAAMGARPATFMGLSGMGDLVLTCTGDLSRNRRVGLAIGRGRRADRIDAAAALVAAIHERTGPFAKLIREAAATDEEFAELLRATRERQRADVEAGLELILRRRPTDHERDGAWAIVSPEVHLLLVEGSGWSVDQYRSWLSETLERVLPRS